MKPTFFMPLNLVDKRIDAQSCLTIMKVGDYLDMISLHDNPYQRGLLAKKNYRKLVDDLLLGTVMPPISVVYPADMIDKNTEFKQEQGFKILDGLQRTNCLFECLNLLKGSDVIDSIYKDANEFKDSFIYVEIWSKMDLRQTLYKMVVLNTGQKKMDYQHQLDILGDKLREFLDDKGIATRLYSEKKSGDETKLSTLVEGLVSYIAMSPMPGKKNAAEFLFEKFDANLDSSDDVIFESLNNKDTYNNLLFVLKDFSDLFDDSYANYNPIKKYDVFIISLLAAMGSAHAKNSKLLKKKIENIQHIDDLKAFFNKDSFEYYYNNIKSGIGQKRRKYIYEAFRAYFVTEYIDKIEWENAYNLVAS